MPSLACESSWFISEERHMRNVRNTVTGITGITVGRRKDGSVAVLFDDDSIGWFEADPFGKYFEEV